jgi:hypothetical protein
MISKMLWKKKMKSELTLPEKTSKVESRVSRAEGIITEIERMKIAQKLNLPYYTASGVRDVSKRDFLKVKRNRTQRKILIK